MKIENQFGNEVRLGRNQRYESWRMPYGESCSMPHAHAATRIHTVDLAHSSLGIPRLANRGVNLFRGSRYLKPANS